MKTFFLSLICSLLAAICSSCGSTVPPTVEQVDNAVQEVSDSNLPSRRDLRRTLRDKKSLIFVYGSQNADFRQKNKEIAELNRDRLQGYKSQIFSDEEVNRDSLMAYPVVLIGSPNSNTYIQELHHQLPVSWEKDCLFFDKREWCEPHTVFSLGFYPNPLNTEMPLLMVTANDDQDIYDLFTKTRNWDHVLWDGWDYKIFENLEKRLIGKFKNESGEDWSVKRSDQLDLQETEAKAITGLTYEIIDHNSGLSAEEKQLLLNQREARCQEIKSFFDIKHEIPKISYHLYPSTEKKGLLLHNTDQMHIDFRKNMVCAVHNDEFQDHPIERDNELVLRNSLNHPQVDALERGLGIYFTENWQGKGYMNWAKLLYQSDNMAPISDLFDDDLFKKESEFVMGALAGSLVAYLIEEQWDVRTFVEKYPYWQPKKAELAEIEKGWHRFLAQSPTTAFADRREKPKACFRGFNFTHEGYQIYNGYISQKATESLQHIHSIGSNAVAIVPYTGMRDHTKPAFLPHSNGPGTENDESIIHSLFEAKKLGMTTLIKPQVWLWNSWPGDVQMKSEEDWQQFFDYYYRWIRHYAMMSEMREADIFCLGVEFSHATLSHEKEWRAILKKIRGLFKGPITYAANWGQEFEKIELWEELDYIGINCYYPLSKKDSPTEKELKEGCELIMQKVNKVYEKYQKPILFTEIGFRSVEAPWQHPHEEAGSRNYNGAHQAQAYRITFEAIKGQPWCQGIFWWKWPTIMTNSGSNDRRFIPYKKPAEEVIKEYYQDWE